MEDKLEKKLRQFLPYIIILALAILALPAILRLIGNNVVVNQIVFVGIIPLVIFSCGVHYAYKNTADLWFCLISPIIFIPTMLLYGMVRDNPLNSIIYLIAYLVCGYIGITVGELIAPKQKEADKPVKTEFKGNFHVRKRNVPKTVSLSQHIEDDDDDNFDEIVLPQNFENSEHAHTPVENKEEDDFEYGYDLDSILSELRNKRDDN